VNLEKTIFDSDIAISFCKQEHKLDLAVSIAKDSGNEKIYLKLLIDKEDYDEAIEYIKGGA
jgi:hypothetical protein